MSFEPLGELGDKRLPEGRCVEPAPYFNERPADRSMPSRIRSSPKSNSLL